MKKLILALVAVVSMSVFSGCAGNPPVGADMFANVPAGPVAYTVFRNEPCPEIKGVVCVPYLPLRLTTDTGRRLENSGQVVKDYWAAEKKQLTDIGAVARIMEQQVANDNRDIGVGGLMVDVAAIVAPVSTDFKKGFAQGIKGFSTKSVEYQKTSQITYEIFFPDGKKMYSPCEKGTPVDTCRAMMFEALKARGQQQISSSR